MILQALTRCYEQLRIDGKVEQDGWSKAKVSYAITVDREGAVRGIIPLSADTDQEKVYAAERIVPYQKGRSRQIAPHFLCDNAKYLLGAWYSTGNVQMDQKNRRQAREYFAASKNYHCDILKKSSSAAAVSICRFFERWDFDRDKDAFEIDWEQVLSASNLVFRSFETREEYQDIADIKKIWTEVYDSADDGGEGLCLVTGKRAPIARLHPMLKGVRGAQSSGAALVSFNASAFESYGKKQGDNAPVSEYAANAYTTALNYLLSDKEHRYYMGDTTVVFWAENGQPSYSDFFAVLMGNGEESDEQKVIRLMHKIVRGEPCFYHDTELLPATRFFVLGLSPNAARVSVRFFYQSTFGSMISNINEHYRRMEIVKPSFCQTDYPNIGAILHETVNKNSSKAQSPPVLAGALMRAVLNNQRYPEALYSNMLMRIHSERNINRNKAAVIKAYLLKNHSDRKEVIETMELNESTEYAPYVLGRIFAVLEDIQRQAIGKETIRGRFFNSACSTPATVFPQLFRVAISHLKVLERDKKGMQVQLDRQLQELVGKVHTNIPKYLSLEDQGIFLIGYYHQVQKRYEKKIKHEEEA